MTNMAIMHNGRMALPMTMMTMLPCKGSRFMIVFGCGCRCLSYFAQFLDARNDACVLQMVLLSMLLLVSVASEPVRMANIKLTTMLAMRTMMTIARILWRCFKKAKRRCAC